MFQNTKSVVLIEAEKVLVEVFRITKLSNQKAMYNITGDDFEYLANNLALEYLSRDFNLGMKILKESVAEFFTRSQSNDKIEVGDFLRLCHANKRSLEEAERSKRLISSRPLSPKSKSREMLGDIKEQLKNCIKPLPYNKDYREPPPSKYGSYPGDGTDKMGFRELEEHLSKKRLELHADLVSFGQIRAFEDVENEELRALYKKAWTHGVTREEKDRMQEISGNKVIM